jgi:hypothetical protein
VATPDQDPQQPSLLITPEEFAASQPANPARRRFGRAGAAAAGVGVLATLKSTPGMACTICWTPSAEQSIVVGNSHHKENNTCNGISPEAWLAKSTWPVDKQTFLFKEGFTSTSTKTMLRLMQVGSDLVCYRSDYASGSTGTQQYNSCVASCNSQTDAGLSNDAWMMKYLCANYLNMRSGRMPFLTPTILNGMWVGWTTKGYYIPNAGANKWYIAEMKKYLTGTV